MWRLLLLTMALWISPAASGLASELVLLFTNDVHGRLEPRSLVGGSQVGGAPALASILQLERSQLASDQDLLLVDSGDFLLGSLRDLHHRGAPAIEMMNRLGYQAVALGNHEFDLGWGTLRLRAREAHFPLLSANLTRPVFQVSPRGIHPSRLLVLPRSGRKVGVVGLTMEKSVEMHPESRNPGLQLGAPGPALQRELDRLQGQGAELIVVLSHQGVEADLQLLKEAGGGKVDVLIGGHYPSTRVDQRVRHTRLLQAYPEGTEVGRLAIPWSSQGPDLDHSTLTWIPWADHPGQEKGWKLNLRRYPYPREALAQNPARWGFRETCAWVLQSMDSQARVRGFQPDLLLINRGALRASLPRGEITPRTLFRIAPFENHLVYLELSGRRLTRLLKDLQAAREGKILWLGESLEVLARRRRIKLVMNDYLAKGGDGVDLFRQGQRMEILPDTVQDSLRRALQEGHRPLKPPTPLPSWMLRRKASDPK